MMIDLAANYNGVAPATMSPSDFDEVLFELFPRKVSVEPEQASAIVNELKAFWQFLHRQYGLGNAAEIEATLGPAAVKRLERELADPRNYGMAKSFFMAGKQAGFDMTTEEGLAAFQLIYNSQLANGGPLPASLPDYFEEDEAPSLPGALTPKQRADKRKAKKRQRQNRKRNRK
jgi:hypothetical protein